jgi:outer membrane protein OmpA-like peptidoglycan-associated protein
MHAHAIFGPKTAHKDVSPPAQSRRPPLGRNVPADQRPAPEAAPGVGSRLTRDFSRVRVHADADAVTKLDRPTLQRACDCGGTPGPDGECAECKAKRIGVRRSAAGHGPTVAPPIVHSALRSPGRPLEPSTRAFFESRLGHDLGRVRLHTDGIAAHSASAVNALAYTVGNNIVFGRDRYRPDTAAGRRLLAHELVHTVQQRAEAAPSGGDLRVDPATSAAEAEAGRLAATTPSWAADVTRTAPTVSRSVVTAPADAPGPAFGELGETNDGPLRSGSPPGPPGPPGPARPATPETCPPPSDMPCPQTTSNPSAVTNTLIFPTDSPRLDPRQIAEVDAAAAAWHAMGSSATVRVDGYASAEGPCGYNWGLSCRRAIAVASELASPSDGSPGVPAAGIEKFAHGESNDAGPALPPNRRATISIPVRAVPPPRPPVAVSCLPHLLGSARGCGTGPDFTHHDFPSISSRSEAVLTAWAALHPPFGLRPVRSLIANAECEAEMAGVLGGSAGADGLRVAGRFFAGTGGTVTHGATSTLGSMALVAGSFLTTVAAVQRAIEAQLAAQSASGSLNPCTLSVTPPATHFSLSDGLALKAVIGGTHGERLFVTSFLGSASTRTYTIALRFVLCDNFGVDETDLYAPGLVPFWVLQHERGTGARYVPFINELDLPVVLSGTF